MPLYNVSVSKRKTFLKRLSWRSIVLFLLFHFIFSVLLTPILIFYGPFQKVKITVTGMSWNSLNHKYIARFFLSEEEIRKLLAGSYAVDPFDYGEKVHELRFDGSGDKVEVYHIKSRGFTGKMIIVQNPTRIEVGYSSLLPRSGQTVSAIAGRYGAIAAINGGGFMDEASVGTGGSPMGFIIHHGEVVYDQIKNENIRRDTAAFTEEGMLIVGKHSIKQLKTYGVKEAVSFGPPLVVNGKKTIEKGDGGWGIAPRTAIGQRNDGAVLMLVIDGRKADSLGATLKDVQDMMVRFGAVNAVNLDGGSSTTMYYHGKVINRPADVLGERSIPSVFLVMPTEVKK